MAFFEQLVHDDSAQGDTIAVDRLGSAFDLFLSGVITVGQIETEFDIDPVDSDWVYIKGRYTAAADKKAFVSMLKSLMVLAEGDRFGLRTKATFAAALDLITSAAA